MNLNPLLGRFMELVTYDQTVHSIENEIDTLLEQIFELEEVQKKNAYSLEKEHILVRELKKSVDEHELQMKILDQKVTAAKTKVSTASTGREYELLKKEFDTVAQEQNTFEDELLTSWNAFEQAQKQLIQKEAVSKEQQKIVEGALEEKTKQKDILENKLAEKQHERIEKQQGLPEQWLADYARMRRSVSNPVVALENGSCSACSEALSVHEIAQLHRKQLAPCRGCFRFLFIKP